MTCGHCGAKIADKAIVCYRCGTPTAVPPVRPRRPGSASPSRVRLVILLLILAALLFYGGYFMWRSGRADLRGGPPPVTVIVQATSAARPFV